MSYGLHVGTIPKTKGVLNFKSTQPKYLAEVDFLSQKRERGIWTISDTHGPWVSGVLVDNQGVALIIYPNNLAPHRWQSLGLDRQPIQPSADHLVLADKYHDKFLLAGEPPIFLPGVD